MKWEDGKYECEITHVAAERSQMRDGSTADRVMFQTVRVSDGAHTVVPVYCRRRDGNMNDRLFSFLRTLGVRSLSDLSPCEGHLCSVTVQDGWPRYIDPPRAAAQPLDLAAEYGDVFGGGGGGGGDAPSAQIDDSNVPF